MAAAKRTALLRVGVCILFVGVGANCREQGIANSSQGRGMSGRPIEQVQQEHTDTWMAIPGVVGTAIGLHEDRPCIMVLTATDSEQIKEQIPSTVEGYPIVVQYTGEIRALDEQ